MKSYLTKFKSLLWKIVQMGTSQKLQNSIQTLIIFWPVYPIHTNSLFWAIFVELPFCHFPPPNTSIRGKDSKIQLIFHLNILVFQTNGKQPYSFPALSRFCNGLFLLWYLSTSISSFTQFFQSILIVHFACRDCCCVRGTAVAQFMVTNEMACFLLLFQRKNYFKMINLFRSFAFVVGLRQLLYC